ncbi:hypothetical protein D9M69_494140 [compost metagenome]
MEVEETADQTHAIAGLDFQRLHDASRLGHGELCRGVAGQAIGHVAQQERRVAAVQSPGFGLAVHVQPAMALHHQVETRPGEAVGAGMPAAAVTADVEQAGIELEAL